MKILSQREQYAFRLLGMSDEQYRQRATHVDQLHKDLNCGGDPSCQVDSRSQYGIRHGKNADTVSWSPKRRKQQNAMLNELYQKWGAHIPREGFGMIMGGLGGSGKGTIQDNPRAQLDTSRYMRIDPDEIKKEMALRGMIPQIDHLSPMEASGGVHEEASELAKRLADRAHRERRNVLWDTTMASPGSVGKKIQAMRNAGYGQIDGAFVDVDPGEARRRVEKRHRESQEAWEQGEGLGGRWVPSDVSASNLPTKPGFQSRNAEVFDEMTPEFHNTVHFDFNGADPVATKVTGNRWHNHPLSTGGSTTQTNIMGVRRHRHLMADDQFSAQPTVKELLDQYEAGQIEFGELVSGIAAVGHFALLGGDLAEVYRRAEEGPDDNAFAHVETAEFLGILTSEQVEQIAEALGQQQ